MPEYIIINKETLTCRELSSDEIYYASKETIQAVSNLISGLSDAKKDYRTLISDWDSTRPSQYRPAKDLV